MVACWTGTSGPDEHSDIDWEARGLLSLILFWRSRI